jgi:hypothetical protein
VRSGLLPDINLILLQLDGKAGMVVTTGIVKHMGEIESWRKKNCEEERGKNTEHKYKEHVQSIEEHDSHH